MRGRPVHRQRKSKWNLNFSLSTLNIYLLKCARTWSRSNHVSCTTSDHIIYTWKLTQRARWVGYKPSFLSWMTLKNHVSGPDVCRGAIVVLLRMRLSLQICTVFLDLEGELVVIDVAYSSKTSRLIGIYAPCARTKQTDARVPSMYVTLQT